MATKVEIIMSDSKPVILVPTAFSEQSLLAVTQAATYSKNINAKMVILDVVEDSSFMGGIFGDKDKRQDLKKQLKTKLEELAETFRAQSIEVETLVGVGTPWEKIVEIAELLSAEFIVMGTDSSRKGIMKRFIGSNAMRVVTSAPCPVITIKGDDHKSEMNHIILPLDLQKETKQKIGRAIEVAKRRGATIHLISVLQSMDEFLVNALKRNFHQAQGLVTKAGVKLESQLIQATSEDSISDLILDYSANVNADLIVIMTQEEVNFTEYFLGSSAQQLVHRSRVPVMSIRPKKASGDLIGATGSY